LLSSILNVCQGDLKFTSMHATTPIKWQNWWNN
jgi:hypothetical protein